MSGPARLQACDLAACEGMCCHDGAWLEPGEEARLRRLVFLHREALPGLPDRFLERQGGGTKTATRPHTYRQTLPTHFPATRCVFALPDARCSLQVLAVDQGFHPWSLKPRVCWMHPLREAVGPDGALAPLPPPADPAADWDAAPDYPGYACFTACGRHRADGAAWEDALAGELACWKAGGPPKAG